MTSRFQNPLAEKAASLWIICVRQKCRIFMFFSSALCSVWMQWTEFWSISNQQSANFGLSPFFQTKKFRPWAVLEQPGPDVIKSFSRQLWRSLESGTSASWCELIGKFYRFFFLQIYIWSFVEFLRDIGDVSQILERYIWSFIEFQKGILKS